MAIGATKLIIEIQCRDNQCNVGHFDINIALKVTTNVALNAIAEVAFKSLIHIHKINAGGSAV